MSKMSAAVFDGQLRYEKSYPLPHPQPGWAMIQVQKAGICKTDMEVMKGYLGFRGILGHEFVGRVESCDDLTLIGKRVVGEINAACGRCTWCTRGLGRHCASRRTLGILDLNGCMAEFCVLPRENLFVVPDEISDERAVLTEPLSAACEILEQLPIRGNERIVVMGDGGLGILCAWVLTTVAPDVTILGHHHTKLSLAKWRGIKTVQGFDRVESGADIVVEATGTGQGIVEAMALCRPRGIIVLKSTVASQGDLNLAPVVIHEQTVIGSRCGRFRDGLAMMQRFPDMPLERMFTAHYPLESVEAAFDRARDKHVLKVILDIAS